MPSPSAVESTEVALVESPYADSPCIEDPPSNISCRLLTCSSNSAIRSFCHRLAAGTQVRPERVHLSQTLGLIGEASHLIFKAWQASQARDLFPMVTLWLRSLMSTLTLRLEVLVNYFNGEIRECRNLERPSPKVPRYGPMLPQLSSEQG